MIKHVAVEPLPSSILRETDPKQIIEVTAFLGYPEEVIKTVAEIASKKVEDRKHWNVEELEDISSIQDFIKVKEWAQSNNLTDFDANVGGRTVKLKGSVRDFEKALSIKIVEYKNKEKGDYRTYEGNVQLPPFIFSLHGLDNRRIAEHHLEKTGRKPAAGSSILAPLVAKAYNFPSGTGSGQTVAIIELGGGFTVATVADLTNYWKLAGVSAPSVTFVCVDGVTNNPNPKSGDDVEVELDIEIPASIATGANYVVYFSPNTDQGFIDAITTAAHDTVNKPSIISISWGGPEDQWSPSTIAAMNQAFQACAAMGITVFAASGDNGNTDGERGPHVDYPASDPFITGCGATNITSLTPLVEQGWQDAGGGASSLFPIPSWQTATIPGATKRSVPDVAGLGGSPGFTVVADGQTGPVEGTSCVAPLWAGLIAIINQSLGKNVGFLNPLIYQHPKAFNDITTGNNGFPAGVGWDPVTGLGTPNGSLLLTALQGGLQPPNSIVVPASLSYNSQENRAVAISLMAADNVSGITGIGYGIITPPTNGTIIVVAKGAFSTAITYNPTTNFVGSDSFTYQATDNVGTKSNIGTVSLTIASTVIPLVRYQLRSTVQKGEPVPDSSWKSLFDSGVLS